MAVAAPAPAEDVRRRIHLDNEVRKLLRLLGRYGEADLVERLRRALVHRTFGAHYVRTCIDQARFARGLGEPPEPVVTGNPAADSLVIEPPNLETYDALYEKTKAPPPAESTSPAEGTPPAEGTAANPAHNAAAHGTRKPHDS